MRRQDALRSRKGLLLVEAVLSAVIIASGLVFISRGLGSQLRALQRVEESETLLSLARGRLLELEAEGLVSGGEPIAEADKSGAFPEPYGAYQWEIRVDTPQGVIAATEDLMDPATQEPAARRVTVAVRRSQEAGRDRTSPTVTLSAIWPAAWIPDEWL